MLLTFIKSIKNEIAIVTFISLLFVLIFFVFSLPQSALMLGVAIILFIMCIYWWISYLGFQKQEELKEKVVSLEEELFEMKNKQIEYRKDVESYFLTWVHQIKTPITASQLLLERNEPNVANQVRQEIVQIDNYTRLALSYLKLLNEASDMTITEVNIDDLIKPLIMKYRIHFIEQHTKIHYQSNDDSILTDAQWTSILIEQILNNALKYARGKDIWIDFDSTSQQLSIKDNGIGISQADLPKIFDKGYSGYNGSLNESSSGIGLFIVKHIAQHLNLNVEVTSELNKGTQFTISFPTQS
ncbi:sensor histidine kinase [Staphylococcus warneri]|jgi:two-component system sensor histidine kinase BraS/BceS|uniref:histidine kinase n=1 Tax=Staphylococcus warneri TaxID=1292 RepID=A0A364UP95_STAWA|nr:MULTISPECIES: sensor histidine kinase [Staphylococcus]AGC89582.1 nisin susceptibility-associated sensor histidine kinase [Staphylococcus warneri SG1]PAK72619.1 histidine kinase [Staphylococcus pasteuri]COR85352.1 histidine kinase [Streptococcus pneumoniae]EGG95859.1 ATPase/histidine kinase/DNA gyrase B/HSP90 domain protein [Staphylococcus warneri VCU121]KEK49948.1 histidine kinase-, DNA gyrase B-, and HSP90-like ATPase family protein [Staphylococcus warneri Lyso 1 2011]